MAEMKKEIKLFFWQGSLGALFDQISRDMKAGYMSIGDLKIEAPEDVEVEVEYKEKEENGKTKCIMEWELKWYTSTIPAGLFSKAPSCQREESLSIWFFNWAETVPNLVGVPKAIAPASRKSSSVTKRTSFWSSLPFFHIFSWIYNLLRNKFRYI